MCIRDRYQRRVRGVQRLHGRIHLRLAAGSVDMVYVRDGAVFMNHPDQPETSGTPHLARALPESQDLSPDLAPSEASTMHAASYGSFRDCELLLPPGPTGEEGVYVGKPVVHPPQGIPIRERRSDYDDFDDDEVHTRCVMLCCGTCCPCCLGDPCTSRWCNNLFNSWCKSFSGIAALAQVVLYLTAMGIAESHQNLSRWGRIEGDLLMDMGAKDPARIVHHYQVYRLLTAPFLSGALIQLIWNVFFLMSSCWLFETGQGVLGDVTSQDLHMDEDGDEIQLHRVSQGWGWWRACCIYSISAVAGGLLGCFFSPHRVCVGSSGAIIGMFGARMAEVFSKWQEESADVISHQKTEFCSLLFQMSLVAAYGCGDSHVDNWGNLGGFVAGLMTGAYFCLQEQYTIVDPSVKTVFQRTFPALCLCGVFASIGVLALLLFFQVGPQVPSANGYS
eukprot:TRINITY_DN2959_c0_g1_i1.p1 TRINITY_DN2959_c0_g1~~TRINITY_DN2959_c0_g1_i1.p1  ORF type:complete len:447 (-),score=70.42 TRINITY_DN2959_c0_g1_i1:335-1675(-)